MRIIRAIFIALSTYSAIPMPQFEWKEESMRYSICFLPLIGAIIGAVLWAWGSFCDLYNIGNVLFASVATMIPLLITGGIHMDGFCDTIDALSSRQSRERMLEILKDAHIGAFALIYCVTYILGVFGLFSEIGIGSAFHVICVCFILSRAIAAISAVTFKNARKTGFLVTFTENASKNIVIISMTLLAVLTILFMLKISFFVGIVSVIFALFAFLYYYFMTNNKLGGVTGDTTGFLIQISELALLLGAFLGAILGNSL